MSLAVALHALAAVIWVGGMFFAYVVLRPSVAELAVPERLLLWRRVLGRFFTWVLGCIAVLLRHDAKARCAAASAMSRSACPPAIPRRCRST